MKFKYILSLLIITNFAAVAQQVIEFKTITEALNYTGDKTAITKIIITDYLEKEKINLLLEEYSDVDTLKSYALFGRTYKCNDYERVLVFNFANTGTYMVTSDDIEGPDKDLFSYTTSPQLPATLKDTILNCSVKFTTVDATPGEKTASIVFTIIKTNDDSIVRIWLCELKAEVMEKNISASPSLLDFGVIDVDKKYTKNIKLEPLIFYYNVLIKTAYLLNNIEFNLDTDLDNKKLLLTSNCIANISVNSNVEGEITDTLIVITENKYCDDTLKVPIVANCVVGIFEVVNNVRICYLSENRYYIESDDDIFDVLLFDVLGNQIKYFKNEKTIDLNRFQPSAYFLRYFDGKKIRTEKLIK